MAKELYLSPATEKFTLYNNNITTLKHSIGSIQWLACQTWPDII